MFNIRAVKCMLASVAIICAATTAHARPFSPAMECGSAANLVSRVGAIVMDTGPHTYDRFVISGAYCTPHEYTKAAFVPTANHPQCFVGYTCEQKFGKHRN